MEERKLRWRVALAVAAAVIGGAVWMLMDRPHLDVGGEQAQYSLLPQELVIALTSGDSLAAHYLNAVVELNAVVTQDDGVRASFEGGVVALWDTLRPHRTLEQGESLHVKGRVTGYDDLFGEVRMDGLVLVHAPDE